MKDKNTSKRGFFGRMGLAAALIVLAGCTPGTDAPSVATLPAEPTAVPPSATPAPTATLPPPTPEATATRAFEGTLTIVSEDSNETAVESNLDALYQAMDVYRFSKDVTLNLRIDTHGRAYLVPTQDVEGLEVEYDYTDTQGQEQSTTFTVNGDGVMFLPYKGGNEVLMVEAQKYDGVVGWDIRDGGNRIVAWDMGQDGDGVYAMVVAEVADDGRWVELDEPAIVESVDEWMVQRYNEQRGTAYEVREEAAELEYSYVGVEGIEALRQELPENMQMAVKEKPTGSEIMNGERGELPWSYGKSTMEFSWDVEAMDLRMRAKTPDGEIRNLVWDMERQEWFVEIDGGGSFVRLLVAQGYYERNDGRTLHDGTVDTMAEPRTSRGVVLYNDFRYAMVEDALLVTSENAELINRNLAERYPGEWPIQSPFGDGATLVDNAMLAVYAATSYDLGYGGDLSWQEYASTFVERYKSGRLSTGEQRLDLGNGVFWDVYQGGLEIVYSPYDRQRSLNSYNYRVPRKHQVEFEFSNGAAVVHIEVPNPGGNGMLTLAQGELINGLLPRMGIMLTDEQKESALNASIALKRNDDGELEAVTYGFQIEQQE